MKFLIYKASGGLFHNFTGLSYAINFCLQDNRILILDMKKHGAFGVKFSDYFKIINSKLIYYDENYDVLPQKIEFNNKLYDKQLIINERPRFKNKQYYFIDDICISKPNLVPNTNIINIFCGYVNSYQVSKYIELNEDITQKLMLKYTIQNNYISVHFRNTDIKNDIDKLIDKIKTHTTKFDIKTIYFASDCNQSYHTLKSTLKNLEIIRNTVPPDNIRNLHYYSGNKQEQMENLLLDVYYILKSNYFIPSLNSGMSRRLIDIIQQNHKFIPIINPNKVKILV